METSYKDNKLSTIIGVMGGMGPCATAYFYELLIKECQEKLNSRLQQDYPRIIIDSFPVPDIIDGIIENSVLEEIFTDLNICLNTLVEAGAKIIVLPCNTVHYFHERLQSQSVVPILHIVESCLQSAENSGFTKVGLLGTVVTVKENLYFNKAKLKGITIINPNEDEIDFIASCILKIIAGRFTEEDKQKVINIISRLKHEEGVSAIILGCTDLSLVLPENECPVPVIDSLKELAKATIKHYKTLL